MTWAFLDDHGHENDKLLQIGGAAAWYWACGLMYCRRKQAERAQKGERFNFIPSFAAKALYADTKASTHIKAIVRVGLWVETEGGYLVHDYKVVYGTDGTDATAAPAAPAESKLTPSQLGGRARAVQASRVGGRFQPAGPAERQPNSSRLDQPPPATHALGSGSGSGSDPKENKEIAEDLTGYRAGEAPAGTSQHPPDPQANWDGSDRETPCPLDLVQRAINVGVPKAMAEALRVEEVQVIDSLREFVSYWTVGGGANQKRRLWMRKAREHVRKAAEQNKLKPIGAIEHQVVRAPEKPLSSEYLRGVTERMRKAGVIPNESEVTHG
jgi:hypothetical protein